MPSQINNPGNVGYGTGGDVSANYLRTLPSTRFATRDLTFLVIDMDNTDYFDGADLPNSNFTKVVRLVQTQAEIYAVGQPSNGVVTIVIAIDTANNGSESEILAANAKAKTIYTALQDAGINVDSVAFRRLVGSSLNNGGSADLLGYNADGSTYAD